VPHQLKPLKKPSSVYPKHDAKGPARHAPPSAPFLIGATAIRTAEIARKTHVARRYADCYLAALCAALYSDRDAKGVTSPEKFVAVPIINRSRSAFLPGSAEYVECDVTHSKQSIDEFLPGSRIACWRLLNRSQSALLTETDSQTETAVNHSKQTMGTFLTETRIAFSELPRMWLIGASLHLTNCRLNRLQLFRSAGVCNNRRLREIAARARNFGAAHRSIGAIHTEASFVVE
jgi:hypothetical protein